MRGTRWRPLIALVALLAVTPGARPAGPDPPPAAAPKVALTWKTCAAGTLLLGEAQACHVIDVKSGRKTRTFELCVGVKLQGTTLLFGGNASSMICATVEVPAGLARDAARKAAEEALRAEVVRRYCGGTCPLGRVDSVGALRFVDGAPRSSK
jgi:hypothetical protein